MKKNAVLHYSLSFFFICVTIISRGFAEQREAERLTIEDTEPAEIERVPIKKGEVYTWVFYEPSNVVIGARRGRWSEITVCAGYNYTNMNFYFAQSRFSRFDKIDLVTKAGGYFKLGEYYFHEEIGFGSDISYIYRFQNILEISKCLYRNLYWRMGYTYRNYVLDNSHLIAPGLTWYFGNHYITAVYGLSIIEGRGTANLGTLKGNFEINSRLHWKAGVTVGEWLYDIYGYAPSSEYGYIIYSGFEILLFNNVNLRIGGLYGTEKPNFIKRSLDVSVHITF